MIKYHKEIILLSIACTYFIGIKYIFYFNAEIIIYSFITFWTIIISFFIRNIL